MGYLPIYAVLNKVTHSRIQLYIQLLVTLSCGLCVVRLYVNCYLLFHDYSRLFVFFVQSFPFFGVVPAVVDEHGNELEGPCEGFLVTNNE